MPQFVSYVNSFRPGKVGLASVAVMLLPLGASAAPAQQGTKVSVSAPFTVASGTGNQSAPTIAGNLVLYSDCGSGKCIITSLDLGSQQRTPISPAGSDAYNPSTDGTRAVWQDARNTTSRKFDDVTANFDIYGLTLSDRNAVPITVAPKMQNEAHISGNTIVWTDYRDARNSTDDEAGDIYMFDITSGRESIVSNSRSAQRHAVTNGKVIVWADFRNEPDPKGYNGDIYGYDIATRQEFAISNAPDLQNYPAISGNIVVWSDFRKGEEYNADLYGYDLTTRKEFLISDAPGSQTDPAIYGNLVVWKDYRNDIKGSNSDIYGYDLTTKQEFPVYSGPGAQGSPQVSGSTIVWEDASKGNIDIMGARVLGAPLAPPVALPGTGSSLFPETGKTVRGIFLDYWKGNGALPQQGFPISEVIGEVSDLNGKPYTVQYFERAVFEYHPEEKPPYNVLLSQLGTFQYRRKYPNGAPNQTPNTSAGTVLFKETNHRVGGKFLLYWQGHGGLPQQGFPISEEFTEVSDLNGKPYTVQYFERAVFELHPENAPPYDVLLSQLGTFQFRQKYGGR